MNLVSIVETVEKENSQDLRVVLVGLGWIHRLLMLLGVGEGDDGARTVAVGLHHHQLALIDHATSELARDEITLDD